MKRELESLQFENNGNWENNLDIFHKILENISAYDSPVKPKDESSNILRMMKVILCALNVGRSVWQAGLILWKCWNRSYGCVVAMEVVENSIVEELEEDQEAVVVDILPTFLMMKTTNIQTQLEVKLISCGGFISNILSSTSKRIE